MGEKRFILIVIKFLVVIVGTLNLYVWMWNPLEKNYTYELKTILIQSINLLFAFLPIKILYFKKYQSDKEFTKKNEITIIIYSLIFPLSAIVYYIFILPANAVILGISLLIFDLLIGISVLFYTKKKNNKNTVLQ
jgi:hypothetical protein